MKKALLVTNLIGFVGFLWNDIEVLQSLGYEITFAANAGDESEKHHQRELKEAGVKFIDLGLDGKNPTSKQNFLAYSKIKKLLAKENYDVVHCHTAVAGIITRLAAKKSRKKGTKVFYTSHGFTFTRLSSPKQRFVYSTIEKFASRFTDMIITINHADYEIAKGMCCKDVRIISGVGVDTEFYHNVDINVNEYKKKLGLPADKIMILSVGKLTELKNHQIIIKALGSLQTKSSYIYVICGKEIENSGYSETLKKLANEYGVDLYLLGHRSDIPQIMHCSDIGAIPSLREGLGLAGIQSLCAEVPLVGTNVQGILEYIKNDVSGYLCEPFDEQGYAQAILKLSDKENNERMKKNCYDIAKKFDNSISKQQIKEIYTSILCE